MENSSGTNVQMPDRDVLTLNGVSYADLGGCSGWRVGSTNPLWPQRLPGTASPSAEDLKTLNGEGIWVESAASKAGPVAVMCCGLGMIWPGIGRELYDSFPAARKAMDRLAACASWDVLGLMDEPDVEVLGRSRWQQPYTFLLEYAQWSILRSLGLEPNILVGHSLGELIALCFAGIYTPETCWHVLDTRSRHMDEIESRAGSGASMLAVYAGLDVVEEVQRQWPALYISNYNTPGQFIFSGPREELATARKALRKRRIPAVMLNVTMAFHNPAMRTLRELSGRRLANLPFSAPSIPMLSCITADWYPSTKPEIIEHIVDLDEHAVRWSQCVSRMTQQEGISTFVECGTQDTLCTFVQANVEQARCLACGAKGHEREKMRETLARLYSLGYLPKSRIRAEAACWPQEEETAQESPDSSVKAEEQAPTWKKEETGPIAGAILDILAKASGRDRAKLSMNFDLRFDLCLRSIQFPGLLEEMEQQTGISVSFEELLKVSTIGDLIRAFAKNSGESVPEETKKATAPLGSLRKNDGLIRAVMGENGLDEVAINPFAKKMALSRESAVAVFGLDDVLTANLLKELAPFGCTFLLPEGYAESARGLVPFGARIEELCSRSAKLVHVLGGGFFERDAHVDVALLGLGSVQELSEEERQNLVAGLCGRQCRRVLIIDACPEPDREGFSSALADNLGKAGVCCTEVGMAEPAGNIGEMLAREIFYGGPGRVFWVPLGSAAARPQSISDSPDESPVVFPERTTSVGRGAGRLEAGCQISADGMPFLASYTKGTTETSHRIPRSLLVIAQLQAARMLYPWLLPVGVNDVHFYGEEDLPDGIVREASILTVARPWLRFDGKTRRMFDTSLSFRNLSPFLRRTNRSAGVSDCTVVLGTDVCAEPIWKTPENLPEKEADSAQWYDAQGLGDPWRLLSDVHVQENGNLSAALTTGSDIALNGVWAYTNELRALESVLQAARMASDFVPPAANSPYRLRTAGFILFGAQPVSGSLCVRLERTWNDGSVVRYNAQVSDPEGQSILTIYHLEFEGAAPEAPQK